MTTTNISIITRVILIISLIINVAFIGNHFAKKYGPSLNNFSIKKQNHYLNRQTVFDLLPVTNTDIVFAGDSHTQFFEVHEFLPNHAIKNRGIFGDYSAGLLNRMNQITPGQPKKIFIEIGFNDIGTDSTPDSVYNNTKMIVDEIKKQSPNTAIYINSIFPGGRDYYKAPVPIFNAKLKKLCADYKLPYIDVYSKLAVNGLLEKRYDSGDGIHLSGAGYAAWAECLKPYL